MPMSTGARLGVYQVVSPIGAGGMGEVYRAHDSKLGRDVALKVLPANLAGDAQYMARFQREAQVLASLNHPHIASIYGLEECGGVRALVMELVEGPTLADRIKKGPIPLTEALDVAKQIAEALEYAHEKGVIHRDLKPANVKITPEGTVKVLDFGLAKAAEQPPETQEWEDATTLPASMSRPGVILGTPAYMAPEQARGEAADKRADIWAFGVVLLEMLTGKRTFSGETTSDTLAAVLTKDPDWERLPAATPASVSRLLKRCLERDPRKRLRDIGDARMQIDDSPADSAAPVRPARRSPVPWAVSAGLLIALAAVLLLFFRRGPPESPLVQFTIPPPEKEEFEHLAPSPDGRMIAFSAGGTDTLWLRRLNSLTSQRLDGGDGALLPFWSPDSRFLGFWAHGKLQRIDVEAPIGPGRLRIFCDAARPGGATWSRDGIIVFSGGQGQPLYRISASGGEAVAITSLDPSRQEKTHYWPWFLPDGRHFLYTIVSEIRENSGVYVGTLDSPERKRLLGDLSNAVYVTAPALGGLLLFVRGDTLMAQRLDAATLRLSAEPFSVAEQVEYGADFAEGSYAVSANGVLVYKSSGEQSQLTWFDRAGKRIGTIGEPGIYNGGFRLSPDGTRVAVARRDPNTGTSDIWLMEADGSGSSRFTFDPKDDVAPVWSPDGKRLVFSSDRAGAFDLYQKDVDGDGREELLLKSGSTKWARDWSPDGRFLLYHETNYSTQGFLRILPLFGDRKPVLVQITGWAEGFGAFSPDGKWVAYGSIKAGKSGVYVRPVPGTEATEGRRISIGAGYGLPQWRRDGKELYISQWDSIVVVEVNANPTSEPGVPHARFDGHSIGAIVHHNDYNFFAATGDGQRFLILSKVEASMRVRTATVVLNWTKGLKP